MVTDTTTYTKRSTEDTLEATIGAYLSDNGINGVNVISFDMERVGNLILWTIIHT